jgi:hypothetical protein
MKSSLRIIPVLFATATLAHSQGVVDGVASEVDTAPTTPTAARILGEIPDGKSTFEVTGGNMPTAGELVVIQSLHDIYTSELERLKTAYAGRERARIEREEYLKANPPLPKDITLNFWRTEKPAADGKGESK